VAALLLAVLLSCPAEGFEERVMSERFGTTYAAYSREVGGFVPRFRA
jgi:protein-S-isoprenylcysteine O-methyltransferase Ste14